MSTARRRARWLTGWHVAALGGLPPRPALPSTDTDILPPQGGIPPCLRKARGLGGWVVPILFLFPSGDAGPPEVGAGRPRSEAGAPEVGADRPRSEAHGAGAAAAAEASCPPRRR